MFGVHLVQKKPAEAGSAVSFERLDDANQEVCIVMDPSLASAVARAFAALATIYAALHALPTFAVMFTLGYFFKDAFRFLEDEIQKIWKSPTHHHGDVPCEDRKALMLMLACIGAYCLPRVAAIYAGCRLGQLAHQFVSSHPGEKPYKQDTFVSPVPADTDEPLETVK